MSRGEIIFVGTGPSTGVPRMPCLMMDEIQCVVCSDALKPGSKNRRRNPSILIRYKDDINILIDCGKTFRESMINIMKIHRTYHIDAVIITHCHADAVLGLDDIREFTETRKIPIYINERDFPSIARIFPYLVDTNKATGSGYVSQIEFIQFDPTKPFNVLDLQITPLIVDHGPNNTCLGFAFGGMVYISDVVGISDTTRQLLRDTINASEYGLQVMVLDALCITRTNLSHWNFLQMFSAVKEWDPKKTYIVGMGHEFDYNTMNAQIQKINTPPDAHHLEDHVSKLSIEDTPSQNNIDYVPTGNGSALKNEKEEVKKTLEEVIHDLKRQKPYDIEMAYDGLKINVDLW